MFEETPFRHGKSQVVHVNSFQKRVFGQHDVAPGTAGNVWGDLGNMERCIFFQTLND